MGARDLPTKDAAAEFGVRQRTISQVPSCLASIWPWLEVGVGSVPPGSSFLLLVERDEVPGAVRYSRATLAL